MNAMPHPVSVCEIAPTHVAAARWNKGFGGLAATAREPLIPGAVAPSPVETNIAKPEAVRDALTRALRRIPSRPPAIALLLPDAVVRVFIFGFETFPRRSDVEEAAISWMRQLGRDGKLEIVAAVARRKIVREYEEAVEAAGLEPSVVMSSSLATLPLLENHGSTLFIRMSGRSLTSVIVGGETLCVFRSTDTGSDSSTLTPHAVLDEVFPAIAYFQDTWGAGIDRVRFAGFGSREGTFRQALANELKCEVSPLAQAVPANGLAPEARSLLKEDLEPLVGWMANGTGR
jgi:type IV pilus assembly protein PilM